MSEGDLLYIVAFIILPTAVLVSCIWALVLLRKGVLLPVRPPARHDISQMFDNQSTATETLHDPVEETGEHAFVEATASMASDRAQDVIIVGPVLSGADEVTERGDGDVVVPDEEAIPVGMDATVAAADDTVPPAERTQEMTALRVESAADLAPRDTQELREPETVHDTVGVGAEAPVPEAPVDGNEPGVAGSPDLLMVPLDEPLLVSNHAVSIEAARVDDPVESIQSDDAPPDAGSEGRRAARRMLKPAAGDSSASRPRVGQRRGQRGQEP